MEEIFFSRCGHSRDELPRVLPRTVKPNSRPEELNSKCLHCDYADFEKAAAPSWTRYYARKQEIEGDMENVGKYQRLVDYGKQPPPSTDTTQALDHGEIRLEKLDAVRKHELRQIWAPFNVFWGHDPDQGSEFTGRRAAMYKVDADKDKHSAQGSSKSSKGASKGSASHSKGSSKGAQRHPPTSFSSRSSR